MSRYLSMRIICIGFSDFNKVKPMLDGCKYTVMEQGQQESRPLVKKIAIHTYKRPGKKLIKRFKSSPDIECVLLIPDLRRFSTCFFVKYLRKKSVVITFYPGIRAYRNINRYKYTKE